MKTLNFLETNFIHKNLVTQMFLVTRHLSFGSRAVCRLGLRYSRSWAGWLRHVARTGKKRNAYRLLVGKPEGKRPLGRPRRMWVNNIRMDL
jgi:hypothetical protein